MRGEHPGREETKADSIMIRKSLSYIHRTGDVPHSWIYEEALTLKSNDALYFCRERVNTHRTVTVYRRSGKTGALGRCMWKKGILILRSDAGLDTLAHEVAHMAYHSHGKRHLEMTKKIGRYWGIDALS